MTPADLDRCRRSWAAIQAMPVFPAQPMAVVFFAATWIDELQRALREHVGRAAA